MRSSNSPQQLDSESLTTKATQGDRLYKGRIALFFALLLVGLTADLVTKSILFDWLFDPLSDAHQEPYWLINDVFGFQCSTNPGALFGMGRGYSWLFAIFSVIALAGIGTWLFAFGGLVDRWLTVSLGLISGGILGNLYDRLGLGWQPDFPESIKYNVRDWILFRLKGVPFFDPWPNFNVADMLLVSGAVLLMLHAFFWMDVSRIENSKFKKQ